MRRGHRSTRWRNALCTAVVLAAAMRLFALQGCWRTIRIEGASMAPALHGTAWELTCLDCGFAYRLAEEYLPQDGRSVCPNCGFAGNQVAMGRRVLGDRIWIDRWPRWSAGWNRFDVVAVEGHDGVRAAKRLLGFPGEAIEFREGDLWVDGRRVEKTMAQFRRLAVLVHDADHVPSLIGAPRRWVAADGARSGWKRRDVAWFHDGPPEGRPATSLDWLEYRHRPPVRGLIPPRTRADEIPVFDTYAGNGDRTRGPLHVVADLIVETHLWWGPRDGLAVELRGTGEAWRVELDRRTAHVTWYRNDVAVGESTCPELDGPSRRTERLQFGLLDGRLVVALDDHEISTRRVADPAKLQGHTRPVRLAVVRGHIVLSHLKLWRDLYYFGPDPTAATWQRSTRRGWFLVGDNLPVSIDQRIRPLSDWRPFGRVIDGR